jgi:hypothetical protein
MTAHQYRNAIEKIGLSQIRAGKFLGVPTKTSSRWALGESRVPAAVGILLRLMIATKMGPGDVAKAIEKVRV